MKSLLRIFAWLVILVSLAAAFGAYLGPDTRNSDVTRWSAPATLAGGIVGHSIREGKRFALLFTFGLAVGLGTLVGTVAFRPNDALEAAGALGTALASSLVSAFGLMGFLFIFRRGPFR